jgi:hypothetical protein
MIKFNIKWYYVIADGKEFEINLIDDAESTPGTSRQYTRFKSEVYPKLKDYLEDNTEATFKDVEKFLKENGFKVLNVYNTDNDGIVNHYLIESIEK